VNLVNTTLFLAVAAVAYLGWLYIPLWLDDLDVREQVSIGFSQLSSGGPSLDTSRVQEAVATQLSRVGTHWEVKDGAQVEVPGLGVEPGDVVVERAPDGKRGRVSLDYDRTVRLKPLDQTWTVRFHTEQEGFLK
jgi:hypothetical protein